VFDSTQPDHNNLIFNGLVTGNCGEQPLPPYGSCLLGSVNLTSFVRDPFTEEAHFDWDEYHEVVKVFTRMLDNVVEVNGLPLPQQQEEIRRKRRHGMGFLGLGSTITMLRMKYGSPEAVAFTERVSKELALAGWEEALELAREKGPAPIMSEEFTITPEMLRKRPELARDGLPDGCCTRDTAATCSASPRPRRSSSTGSRRSAHGLRTTVRSRPPARSRCRSPITRRTALSRRSRTTTSGT
jgi:ribonucleoside-diphosphate reductase alpha chain